MEAKNLSQNPVLATQLDLQPDPLTKVRPVLRPNWPEPIAILGYGLEGKSTLQHLLRWGYKDIRILDRTAPKESPPGISVQFGEDYLVGLKTVATAIRSPGVRPFQPEIMEFQARGGILSSQAETVFSLRGTERIVGVTGTLGKGTCCSLLSAMLTQAGLAHQLAGNIGVPPLDTLESLRSEEWLVLELSSFQLSTLGQSPGMAIVLKTTSEHLDWHASQQEYWDHKGHLTRYQQPSQVCVYFEDSPGSAFIGGLGKGRKIPFGERAEIRISESSIHWPQASLHLDLQDTQLFGAFNLQNLAAAATAALEMGASAENIREAARHFSPLEHRLEFVGTFNGVSFFNDSYATRPDATLGVIRALRGQTTGLILGGSEKYADFHELALGLQQETHVHALALIGQTAQRLESELSACGVLQNRPYRLCLSLEEALEFLRSQIKTGAILLSPACASFGLFANYKDRGYAFKRLVLENTNLGTKR